MKKLMFFLLVVVEASANASLINWTSKQLSYDPEVGSSLQNGWLVALYQDVDGNNASSSTWYNELRINNDGTVTSTGVTANDVFLGITSVLEPDPVDGTSWTQLKTKANVSVTDNIYVYSVILNSSTMEGATASLVADEKPFNVGANDPAVDYNLEDSIAGDYQAVPEPAVGGLIVTFGAGLVLVRRRLSK